MNNHMIRLLRKAMDTGRVTQRVAVSFARLAEPPIHDLEQALSFEFYYHRKNTLGAYHRMASRLQGINKARLPRAANL